MENCLCKKQRVIFLLIIVPLLMGMGVDLYVPSLPAITHYFHVNSGLTQLTIGFYVLGYGVGQLFLGVLSDSFGRRKILLLSGIFYMLFSLSASISPNIYMLILCRFLQGVCIAGLGAVCRAMAADCFLDKLALTKAITYYSISWALGPIIGPFIGGYLQHYFNWKADFYFFFLYGLFVFTYIVFLVPETFFDLQPFHPVKIFRIMKKISISPLFLIYTFLASLIYGILVVFNVIGPFLIQGELKYSAVSYGYIALFLGLLYFLGNILNRYLINYFEPTKVSYFAIVCAFPIMLIALFFDRFINMNLINILIPILLLFFCCGIALSNTTARCMSLFREMAGTASAVFGFFMAGGVALMTFIATGVLKTNTQIPMMITFVIIITLSIILFFVGNILEKQLIE